MNPSGKVFCSGELAAIAELVVRHDAYAICDEVYEHLVFDGHRHIPLMTLPGMRDRTVRIGSAGKTFSATGWKVGYITAAPFLIDAIARAHQFVTFTTPPNLQQATAFGLQKPEAYFEVLAKTQEEKRDRLARGLTAAGFMVLPSAGTYFLVADIRSVGFNGGDEAFCRMLTEQAGVAAVPVSAFYHNAGITQFARFCFCKRDDVLDQAIDRLRRWFHRTEVKPGGVGIGGA
jgi:aspartate/methionine/tyrosine aminotransferase